jgi:antitoxin VapB
MPTAAGRIFRSGNSAAVRLPKDVALAPDTEVTIVRSGDVLTIYPARPPLSEMALALVALPRPPFVEARDDEDLQERPGL